MTATLDADCRGWEPYSLDLFRSLLELAIPAAAGTRFLDIGSGTGEKLAAARELGLDPEGVEINDAYADEADRHGLVTHRADARTWDRYGDYDIVYLNHPLVSEDTEADFERWLHPQLQPGAVLVQVNDCIAPGWPALFNDRERWCGVWRRP